MTYIYLIMHYHTIIIYLSMHSDLTMLIVCLFIELVLVLVLVLFNILVIIVILFAITWIIQSRIEIFAKTVSLDLVVQRTAYNSIITIDIFVFFPFLKICHDHHLTENLVIIIIRFQLFVPIVQIQLNLKLLDLAFLDYVLQFVQFIVFHIEVLTVFFQVDLIILVLQMHLLVVNH